MSACVRVCMSVCLRMFVFACTCMCAVGRSSRDRFLVASCKLQVSLSRFQVGSCKLNVVVFKLQVASPPYELHRFARIRGRPPSCFGRVAKPQAQYDSQSYLIEFNVNISYVIVNDNMQISKSGLACAPVAIIISVCPTS